MPVFEVWDSPVLTQNPGVWNFHDSLTLNNGKSDILKAFGMIFTNMLLSWMFWHFLVWIFALLVTPHA